MASFFLRGRIPVALVAVLSVLLGGLPPFAVGQPTDSTSIATMRAQKLFVRGMTQSYLEDHEEAVSYFEKALDQTPQEPEILMALADAEAARGNVTSALYYARQVRDRAPSRPYYHRRLAELMKRSGRLEDAAETYQSLLASSPAHNEARLALARLQEKLQRPEEALRSYETLIDSSDTPRPQTRSAMLDLYEQTGDDQGREKTLKALIDLRQQNRSYRRRLAQLYVEQERFKQAIPLYRSILRQTPNDPHLLSQLKKLYNETGRTGEAEELWESLSSKNASPEQLVTRARSLYQEANRANAPADSSTLAPAVQRLRRALNLDSSNVAALDLLGTIYDDSESYAQAASVFQRALDLNPRAPERWQRAASALLDAGRPQRAAQVAEEGLLLFPGHAALTGSLAFAQLRLGQPETALSRFQKALDQFGKNESTESARAALHAGRGLARDRLNHSRQAQSAYEASLELDRNQPTALRHFALHLAGQEKNLNRALRLAQRAVEARPSDPEALDALGWVHFKRGALTEAESFLQRALDTGEAPAVVYEHVGDLHRAQGNENRARRYWKKALHLAPDRDSLRRKLDSIPES